jgi:membrane protease YdiL (CAAX protease family)
VLGTLAGVVLAVAATAVAGFVFTWLRRRSGSLLAPIALHWSLNGLGALAAAWCGTCRPDGRALAGAELAVLELVSARGHVAPGAAVVA